MSSHPLKLPTITGYCNYCPPNPWHTSFSPSLTLGNKSNRIDNDTKWLKEQWTIGTGLRDF